MKTKKIYYFWWNSFAVGGPTYNTYTNKRQAHRDAKRYKKLTWVGRVRSHNFVYENVEDLYHSK